MTDRSNIRIEYIGKFTRDYLVNGDRQVKHCHWLTTQEGACGLSIDIFIFDLGSLQSSKGQSQGHTQFYCELWMSRKYCGWQTGQTLRLPTHEVACGFWIGILTRTNSKGQGQGQGHSHFDCEYLANDGRWDEHCYCQYRKSHTAFRLAYLHRILARSKGQGHALFDCEYRTNGEWANIFIAPNIMSHVDLWSIC